MAKYAPRLNTIERDGKTLKTHHLAHKTFQNRDDLKIAIDADIQAINSTRKSQPLANRRIFAQAETGLVNGNAFRDGNAAPAAGNLAFLQTCEGAMPKG